MTILRVALSQLKKGDVLAYMSGPEFTIRGVDSFGPLVIVDFENDTSTPPIQNGYAMVEREETS